jgi:hypothetical protein
VFTRLRIPQLTGDAVADIRTIIEHFRNLEGKGVLAIDEAAITASQGIKFPATQVTSTDANTLDDYEEGTWTPVLTFSAPGNLAVGYTTQKGSYTKIGRLVSVEFNIVTSSFTHTTASGAAMVSGLPFNSTSDTGYLAVGPLSWQGITKANYTNIVCYVSPNVAAMSLLASGSAQNVADIAATDTPTGGSVILRGQLNYRV